MRTKKICPKCKSNNIELYMGGVLGIQYKCCDCNYIGPIVVEVDSIDKKSGRKERKTC